MGIGPDLVTAEPDPEIIDRTRLAVFDSELDLDGLARHLAGVERVAAGGPGGAR